MKVYAQKQNEPQQNASLQSRLTQHTTAHQALTVLPHENARGHKLNSRLPMSTLFVHDSSRIPVYSHTPAVIQPKLMVNTPGDIYEQEADRVADQVVRMPETRLQRACPCGGGCPKCYERQGDDRHLQAKHVHPSEANGTVQQSLVREVLSSAGQPLDSPTRVIMESSFGHDFSRVRVHTDTQAAKSAESLSASAYTIGRDVVFGAGRYAPGNFAGQRLLVHELSHVVQQDNSNEEPLSKLSISTPSEFAERQADNAVRSMAEGQPPTISQHLPLTIARQGLNEAQQSNTPANIGSPGRPVFFCSKPIMLSRLHGKSHAFFRVGGSGPGNPTYELEHDRSCPCAWQGWPRHNDTDDFNASNATCIPAPMITESCLTSNWSTYPIGQYCAWGPNSNTYTRVIAERCGARGLRPPGDVPGFDDVPPTAGTSGPNPYLSALGICFNTDCDGCPD